MPVKGEHVFPSEYADRNMVLWTDDDIRDFVRDLAEMNGRSANLEMNMLIRAGLAWRRAQANLTPEMVEAVAQALCTAPPFKTRRLEVVTNGGPDAA